MTRPAKILFGGLAAAAIYGLYKAANNQIELLKDSKIDFSGVQDISVKNGTLSFTLILDVHNQSAISVNILGYGFDFSIGGSKISSISSDQEQTVYAHTVNKIPVEASIDLSPALLQVIYKPVDITGTVYWKAGPLASSTDIVNNISLQDLI